MQQGNRGELRVYENPDQLAEAAAELFVAAAADAIRTRGRSRVVLSGGSTPRSVYELLATTRFASRVEWQRVDLFWGDERYVPADHPESNFRMVAEALLNRVPLPNANVHRVPTETRPASAAAAAYEEMIRRNFDESSLVPQFDLIYLGLGLDGHTASLFPHAQSLRETSRLVLSDKAPNTDGWRITMSVQLLNRGRTVAFLIQGGEKAEVLRDVLLGPRNPQHLPAQLIAPEGTLFWLADEQAASLVKETRTRK